MDRLEAMQTFVAVAELRGFAPAARKLGRSPSAVTRGVAALEDRLGVRLLQRTTRAVVLTDAGARYLDRARRILLDVDEAEGAAQATRMEPTGRFVVAAPLAFGRMKVAPLMCAFLARHPAVVGELTLADRMVDLVDEGVDVAVRIGHLADASLVVRKVGETRRVVVASPAYLARRGEPSTLDELAAHDLAHCTALHRTSEWSFTGPNGIERVPFDARFTTNSVEAAVGHAELGFAVTMALAYQVEAAVRAGRLRVVLRSFEPQPIPIQLVYATRRHLSANVRAFAEQIVGESDWHFVALGD